MKKERLEQYDFVRAISCLGIVMVHFVCEYQGCSPFLARLLQSKYALTGLLFVTCFFMLSGGMLYYRYPEIHSLKSFYKKRAESIYPAFYICFLTVFLMRAVKWRFFFYNGTAVNPATLLLSVLGLDGYFLYAIPNYYICGEWFLGAIILLYLLYPYLLYGFQKAPWPWFFLHTLVFLIVCSGQYFTVAQERTLLVCLYRFYLGMVLIKYRSKYENLPAFLISLVMTAFLVHGVLPRVSSPFVYTLLRVAIISIPLFVLLANMGIYLMKLRLIRRIVRFISDLSYYIFLTHHVIIFHLYAVYYPETRGEKLLSFVLVISCTLSCSMLLKKVTELLMRSSFMAALRRGFTTPEEETKTETLIIK